MIAYVIRRCLYAIPTLIGVNVIVFALFFFVNSPDDMARSQRGGKRATPEMIDQWKREHALDLPYFYNGGWRRVGSLAADEKENHAEFGTAGTGDYEIAIGVPRAAKEAQERTLRVQCSDARRLVLPADFDGEGRLSLPAENRVRRFAFRIAPPADGKTAETEEAPKLIVDFGVESPAPLHRVVLNYHGEIAFLTRFTETIFYQRSVKMLFFSYGRADRDGKDIGDEILKRMVPSLSIAVPVLLMALIIDIFCAMISALYRGTYVDYWGIVLCVLMMSISGLFYIVGGQVLFGKMLRLVPISGYDYGWSSLKFIALPVAISVISGMGGSIRFYRTIFLEEINKDYVRTARSKGLSESVVLFVHTLKNAMLPILTGVVASLPFLFAGSLLMESFFAVPGMGSFELDAIQGQDFAVVQAMASLGSFLYIVGLVLTDISYTLVDPRVRLE